MSKERLNELGISLPLFPITSVGSFPKPGYLKKARSGYAQRKIDQETLEQEEERATRFCRALLLGKARPVPLPVMAKGWGVKNGVGAA